MKAASIDEALALQADHERRLADFLAHEIRASLENLRRGLRSASLAELIAIAEILGVDLKMPPDWRTEREREAAALEEEAAENMRRAAELRACR